VLFSISDRSFTGKNATSTGTATDSQARDDTVDDGEEDVEVNEHA